MASRPLRILMLAPSDRNLGGQSVQASRMLAEFRGRASDDVAVTFQAIDPVLPFGLRQIPGLRTVASAFIVWIRLLLAIPRHDAVHVFTAAYWGFLLWTTPAILLARLAGKAVIVNYRDGQCEDHLSRWPGAAATLGLCTRIVSPSGYLAAVMARFGLKVTVIPNLVELSRFRFRFRELSRQPVFLSNRRLEPLYNIGCILRAFALIQQRMPEARLLIAHNGPLRAALESEATRLGLRHVEWRGNVAQAQIAALYDECDVYLNSPNIDNMPGSLLECMASGLPIVSTGAGGIPYIVEHDRTALLVPVNDSGSLAAAALRLWDETGLARRLAENGLAECARYGAGSVIAAWIALYQELAGRPREAARPLSP